MINGNFQKPGWFEHWAEIITWIVMILVLIFIRILPQEIIANSVVYYLIGGIVAFALIYYTLIYRYFTKTQRFWIKDFSDVIIISVLIILAKDYGTYFYSLYFLPIAAAALVLGTIDSLLIATVASLFIVFEIFLDAQGILPSKPQLYLGFFQIGFIVLMTLFCRFLALQVRQERKSREEALAKAKALEVIEKREREFMTLTSHQLYTPLSMIRGFSSMLYNDEKKKLNKKQLDYAGEIYENSKRMVGLISELLSISHIRADHVKFKFENIDPEKLISYVVEQLKPKAEEKKISLKFVESDKKLVGIKADSLRLEQAIFNLVDNAIKFTDDGSVNVKAREGVNELIISVSDTGRGISDQDKEKLFQPFTHGKNILELDKEGNGLGLYIAKTIVEKHGGKVWFHSHPGTGSTFFISLPIK